ncbi:CBS domain-containing protein, partial [bacterium]|nr:CBS domain-containing protein [bacterium]
TYRLTRMGEKVYHGTDMSAMTRITVDQVYDRKPDTVTEQMSLNQILGLLQSSRYSDLPVTDSQGRFLGMISFQDLRTILLESGLADLILARDVLREDVLTVSPGDTLLEALNRFGLHDLDHLPVVDPSDRSRLLGLLTRSDVMARYNKELLVHID